MRIRFLKYGPSETLDTMICGLREHRHNVLKIKSNNSRYVGKPSDVVINWGSTDRQKVSRAVKILNDPEAVRLAASKIHCFKTLTDKGMEHYLPKWVLRRDEARYLIEEEGNEIYCRTLSRASRGRGIIIAKTAEELVDAPLYTVSVPCKREVRVHVFHGSTIDFAQKKRVGRARREELGIELNEEIRNHSNGWIFAREGVTIPEVAERVAIGAIVKLDLDFGAVDMIIQPTGVPKILEINTAPGLEGTSLERYKEAILGVIDRRCYNADD